MRDNQKYSQSTGSFRKLSKGIIFSGFSQLNVALSIDMNIFSIKSLIFSLQT